VRRVLFDENLPRLLRRNLPEFEIRTVQEEGWGSFKNGDLLRRAEGKLMCFLPGIGGCSISRSSRRLESASS